MHHEQTRFVVVYSQGMKVLPLSAPQALSYLPSSLTFKGMDIDPVCVCVCVQACMHVLSCVSAACQAPLFMKFSRQEY